jgi:hypothetical protein
MRTSLYVKFPDHQGKYREHLAVSGLSGRASTREGSVSSAVFIEIPYSRDQGIFETLSGKFIARSGNFL